LHNFTEALENDYYHFPVLFCYALRGPEWNVELQRRASVFCHAAHDARLAARTL